MSNKSFIRGWIAAAMMAASAGTVVPSMAQGDNSPVIQNRQVDQNRPRGGHAGDWLRRYRGLPPREQERALQSDPIFRRLSPDRQQLLRQQLRHFSSLSPQQQQRVLNRMETWEHLTPSQKQEARGLFAHMQQLPPQRRSMVTAAVRDLSSMPPGQRERVIDSDRFMRIFNPEERDIMRRATRLPLAPADNGRVEELDPER